jgi:Uma2 family endonuclease
MIALLERHAVRNQVAPLSVEGYHRLRDLRLLPVKSELLDGVIVTKMTKSPLHTLIAHRLWNCLLAGLPAGYQLRKEDPLTLADSEPEPDLAVVRGTDDDFRVHHPSTAELVVEVAISTVELDRAKAELYARAAVPVYWLVLAQEDAVEVHTDAGAKGYTRIETRRRGDELVTWYGARLSLNALFA